MRRRALCLSAFVLMASFAASIGEIIMDSTQQMMSASDSEAQLIEKLANGLGGRPLKDIAQLLTYMGARNIGIDIDPSETSPVSAIFGLRRGLLQSDMRVRIFMGLGTDEVLGTVDAIEIYAK